MSSEIEREKEAKKIIKSFATAAATTAAAFSQGAFIGADISPLTSLYLEMAKKLAELFDKEIEKQDALELLQKATKFHTGAFISKSLLGWIPGLGNMSNAMITFNSAQNIGWFFYENFKYDRD